MKGRIIILAVLALVAISAAQAQASSSVWRPGSTYYVSEDDATNFLEKGFDYAYCRGIARYGKHGEFPDEEFTRFDCTIELDSGQTCYDVRELALKGRRPGYFRLNQAKAQPKMWCG